MWTGDNDFALVKRLIRGLNHCPNLSLDRVVLPILIIGAWESTMWAPFQMTPLS